jgi:hypothetical protein
MLALLGVPTMRAGHRDVPHTVAQTTPPSLRLSAGQAPAAGMSGTTSCLAAASIAPRTENDVDESLNLRFFPASALCLPACSPPCVDSSSTHASCMQYGCENHEQSSHIRSMCTSSRHYDIRRALAVKGGKSLHPPPPGASSFREHLLALCGSEKKGTLPPSVHKKSASKTFDALCL